MRMTGPDLRLVLPPAVHGYAGPHVAVWFLALYNVAGTARSLIHILAPDSGAGTIASMDTTVAGGANIVGLLAQWGGAQLLMALATWVVLWRYRGLVPLIIAASMLDNIGRVLIGLSKPLVTTSTPPGALSWVIAPLCAVFLVVALMPVRTGRSAPSETPGADR